ncbi:putative toxin-antitoxin system toxin component, PIN family [Candidatus Woesearchaeota archaeon]|nr:putative toxin-antitoxin system toxin component, PIN family [Candidatus Woesearchaeota archaeon]
MRIVVDANIIISALTGSRATLVIIASQNHILYAPKKIVEEILRHKQDICEFTGQTSEEFYVNYEALKTFIIILEEAEYARFMTKALETISQRDAQDADYIACALLKNAEIIWTNDKDFTSQSLIPTKNTKELIEERKQ